MTGDAPKLHLHRRKILRLKQMIGGRLIWSWAILLLLLPALAQEQPPVGDAPVTSDPTAATQQNSQQGAGQGLVVKPDTPVNASITGLEEGAMQSNSSGPPIVPIKPLADTAAVSDVKGQGDLDAATANASLVQAAPVKGSPTEIESTRGAPAPSKTDSSNVPAASGSSAASQPATVPSKASARIIPQDQEVQIISSAPKALVKYGDDINPNGACEQEVNALCSSVKLGDGRLATCIREAAFEEHGSAAAISQACMDDILQYKIDRNSNINRNLPLARACSEDVTKFCGSFQLEHHRNGSMIRCLLDFKDKVSQKCQVQLFVVQKDRAIDFRADADLHAACKTDAEELCKGIPYGEGRIQECLRSKFMDLSYDCGDELFRKDEEDADDVRLSIRLFRACLPDKKQFCAEVPPGKGRVKDCLEENRPKLSMGCKKEIDTMIEERVKDFRLDSRLRETCEDDMYSLCPIDGDLDASMIQDTQLVYCLQDFKQEIRNEDCKSLVNKYMELAAQDIRFNAPLAEACYGDRIELCGDVPPGSARVIRCLQRNHQRLSPDCRATLFDEHIRFSENIDFQFPMKSACEVELQRFCADVPHGDARAIRCLQNKMADKGFGASCREEVQKYQANSANDFRLNHRLYKACDKIVSQLCKNVCVIEDGEICGGKVLLCLTEKLDEITDQQCKAEVLYYQKMGVSDYRNDVTFADACREDVSKFCAKVTPGEGRTYQCLRQHLHELSPRCREENERVEIMEADNVQLNVHLMKACKAEHEQFCSAVAPGQARVFRCLANHMAEPEFGSQCAAQVVQKLRRRQSNWRLDPALRKACKPDVKAHCAQEDASRSSSGVVLKCLVLNNDSLEPVCQRELGRVTYMAFNIYSPNSTLTAPCDDDVKKHCSLQPAAVYPSGSVVKCLTGLVPQPIDEASSSPSAKLPGRKLNAGIEQKPNPSGSSEVSANPKSMSLSGECQALVKVIQPPAAQSQSDGFLSLEPILSQIASFEAATRLQMVNRDRYGKAESLTLTGWSAVAGVFSLVVVVMATSYCLYRKYRGLPVIDYSGYTLVMKHKQVTHL